MELKTGYKQTDIGVIPDDWDVLELKYLCDFIGDGTHHTPKYVDSGIPFYSVENVTENNFSNTKFISEEEHSRLIKRCKPQKEDIFLTRIGSIGETKFVDWDIDGSIYVSLALLRLNKNNHPRYIYNYTKSSKFINGLEKRSLLNATPKKINLGEIEKVEIPLPPTIDEQKAIAEVLSDMDELIDSLDKLIAKKKMIKQGTMQDLLTGKRRLLGFSGEWVEYTLGLLVRFRNGDAHEKIINPLGQYIVVNSKFISTQGQVLKYSSDNISPVYTNEIVMVMSDIPNGRALAKCFFIQKDNIYTLNQRICAFEATNVFNKFLFYLLNRNKYFLSFDSGVSQTNLRKDEILSCPLKIPSDINEQKAIAQILSDMDTEIESSEKKREKYKAIKQGAMQELLTGKTRLI